MSTVEGFRLSPQQRRLWQLVQEDGCKNYCTQATIAITGALEQESLEKAIRDTINRHEILRTTFHRLPGMDMPLQVVGGESDFKLDHQPSPQSSAEQLGETVRRILRQMAEATRDLENEIPLRALIIEQTPVAHMLLLSAPALCLDGPGMKRLVEEIIKSYAALIDGHDFEPETMQYADLAEWQNELLESEESKPAREFWGQQKVTGLSSLTLPFEEERASSAYNPDSVTVSPGPELVRELEALALRCGAPLSAVILAAWKLLLYRITNRSEIGMAVAFDGRNYEELQGAIGLFTRFLPIFTVFDETSGFADVVQKIKEMTASAEQWQECFTAEGDAGNAHNGEAEYYWPISFEYIEGEGKLDAPAERFTLQQITSRTDRFKLKLNCFNLSYGLSLSLEFDSRCLQRDDVLGLANHLLELLASASASPRLPVTDLHIVPAEDLIAQQQMIERARRGYAFTPVHHLIERQAAINAERVAVVSGSESITYAELNARANQVARFLRGRGVGGEQVVAVMMGRGAGMIAGMLGVMKAGAAYLPMDGKQPQGRQAYMLEDAGVRYLLVDDQMSRRAPVGRWEVVNVEGCEQVEQQSRENLEIGVVSDRSLAYVIYTSGTTGEAKGVGVEHRQLSNYVEAVSERLGMRGGESFAVVSTLSADLCNTGIYPTLVGGGRLHVIGEEVATDGERLWEEVEREGIEMMKIVPSHLKAVMGVERAGRGLKKVVVGGEASSWEMVEKVKGEGWAEEVYNHYGPTETTVGVTCWRVEGGRESGRVAIGEMLGNVRVYVMDERGRRVGVGMSGEIHIGGEAVSRGYIGKEAETAERYLPDAYSGEAGARMYRTGDRGRIRRDGRVEFLGRVDQQIKLRGYRIELGEIESVLGQYSSVSQAVVITSPKPNDDMALVAYVACRDENKPSVNDLRSFLRDRLPDYMIPSYFFLLDRLPLNENGKVDRKRLLEIPLEDSGQSVITENTPTEEILISLLSELLGKRGVGKRDNFFEVGGHSLLATQFITRIREIFSVDFSLSAFFDQPTIDATARHLDAVMRSGSLKPQAALRPVDRSRDLPLSFSQQRLWFLNKIQPESAAYNIPTAVRMVGQLDAHALATALNEIERRHEILRTSFHSLEGRPIQRINAVRQITLSLIDLRQMPDADAEIEIRRLVKEDGGQSFDLERGPLWRAMLVKASGGEHVLILTMHHIVTDMWSLGVLVRELVAHYEAFRSYGEPSLPALPIQYADYAALQHEWLSSQDFHRQLSYWKQQLADLTALRLPTDRPRGLIQGTRGEMRTYSLSEDLSNSITDLSRREGVTLFMTLLTSFQIVLGYYSGQDDVVVGTDIANRNRAETEDLIGLFVNQLVLRTDLASAPTFKELLRRVRRVTLGAYANQDVPFDRIVDELKPERTLGRNPLFQVLFGFRNAPIPRLELAGLEVEPLRIENKTTPFDLSHYISVAPHGLSSLFRYNIDLFEATTIDRLFKLFETVIANVVADPGIAVSDLNKALAECDLQERLAKEQATEEGNLRRLRSTVRRPTAGVPLQ